MTVSETLLPEFDREVINTRKTLERVPARPDFVPHPKSTPLGRLAAHVAQLPEFGFIVVDAPQLDFSTRSLQPLRFESAAQLVKAFDEGAARLRQALGARTDEAWQQNWKLLFQGKPIFEGTRFMAYRQMFLNHEVHHRAQLGVYLRLNGVAVPSIYGPSADEPGF